MCQQFPAWLFFVGAAFVVSPARVDTQATKGTPPGAKPAAQPATAITGPNGEVVALVKSGASESTIVTFVNTYQGTFDTSAKAVVALVTAGVPERIIDSMMAKAKSSGTAPANDAATGTPAKESILPDGATVKLQLLASLSSEFAQLNDPVKLVVVEDVTVDGRVVVKKGTFASGRVTQTTRQLLTRGGRLDVTAESVDATNGAKVRLKGTLSKNGGRGLVRGNEAIISSNTDLVATSDGPTNVGPAVADTAGPVASGTTTREAGGPSQPEARVGSPAVTAHAPGGTRPSSPPTQVKDGDASVFHSGLAPADATARVKDYFNQKNIEFTVNPETARLTSDWYDERRCGPGFHRCANKAAVRVTDEAGRTVVRVQVFERKREAGMNSKPWKDDSTSKSKETNALAIALHAALGR